MDYKSERSSQSMSSINSANTFKNRDRKYITSSIQNLLGTEIILLFFSQLIQALTKLITLGVINQANGFNVTSNYTILQVISEFLTTFIPLCIIRGGNILVLDHINKQHQDAACTVYMYTMIHYVIISLAISIILGGIGHFIYDVLQFPDDKLKLYFKIEMFASFATYCFRSLMQETLYVEKKSEFIAVHGITCDLAYLFLLYLGQILVNAKIITKDENNYCIDVVVCKILGTVGCTMYWFVTLFPAKKLVDRSGSLKISFKLLNPYRCQLVANILQKSWFLFIQLNIVPLCQIVIMCQYQLIQKDGNQFQSYQQLTFYIQMCVVELINSFTASCCLVVSHVVAISCRIQNFIQAFNIMMKGLITCIAVSFVLSGMTYWSIDFFMQCIIPENEIGEDNFHTLIHMTQYAKIACLSGILYPPYHFSLAFLQTQQRTILKYFNVAVQYSYLIAVTIYGFIVKDLYTYQSTLVMLHFIRCVIGILFFGLIIYEINQFKKIYKQTDFLQTNRKDSISYVTHEHDFILNNIAEEDKTDLLNDRELNDKIKKLEKTGVGNLIPLINVKLFTDYMNKEESTSRLQEPQSLNSKKNDSSNSYSAENPKSDIRASQLINDSDVEGHKLIPIVSMFSKSQNLNNSDIQK